jgi:hypothetical protein
MGTRSFSDSDGTSIFIARYDVNTGAFLSDLEWPIDSANVLVDGVAADYQVTPTGNLARVVVAGRMLYTGSPVAWRPVVVSAMVTPAEGIVLQWVRPADDVFPSGSIEPVAVSWNHALGKVAVLCRRSLDIGGGFLVMVLDDGTGSMRRPVEWIPAGGYNIVPLGIGIDSSGIYVVGNHIAGGISAPRTMRFGVNGGLQDDHLLTPAAGFTSSVRAARFASSEGPFMAFAAEVQQIGALYSKTLVGSYSFNTDTMAWELVTGTWDFYWQFGSHRPADVCAALLSPANEIGASFRIMVTGRIQNEPWLPGDIYTIQMKRGQLGYQLEWEVLHMDSPNPFTLEDEAASISWIADRLIVAGTREVSPGDKDHVLHFYRTEPLLSPSERHIASAWGPEKNPSLPGPPYFNGPNDRGIKVFGTMRNGQQAAAFAGRSYHPITDDDAMCELYVIPPP